jgi:Caspase domain
VRNNLSGLAESLCDPRVWGLARPHCAVVPDPESSTEMLDPVVTASEEAADTLLLYYAGHGLIDAHRGELHLALVGSDPDQIWTAVAYSHVRDTLLVSRARCRIVILDCCYSGRALGQMSGGGVSAFVEEASAEGTYMLAAAAENKAALAPPDEKYTAFTSEFLKILREGIPDRGELLELDTIYNHVRAAMKTKSRPIPQKRDRNTAGQLMLVRNRAHPVQPPVSFEEFLRDNPEIKAKYDAAHAAEIEAAKARFFKKIMDDNHEKIMEIIKNLRK